MESTDEAAAAPETPASLPVLSVTSTIVFPGLVAALTLRAPEEMALLRNLQAGDLLLQHPVEPGLPDLGPVPPPRVGDIGVSAQLLACIETPGDTLQAVLQGMERVRVEAVEPSLEGPARVRVQALSSGDESPAALVALAEDVLRRYQRLVDADDQLAPELVTLARHNREHPALLADFVAASLSFSAAERAVLVREAGTAARLRRLADLLELRLDSARLARQIRDRARTRLEADQRRQLLREQLREIREALGEAADSDTLAGFQRRMEEKPLSRWARREAENELHRLAGLNVASAEYDVARHHFESLLHLPWDRPSSPPVDLEEFRLHLDASLIGLATARAEIVEFAAVLRLHGTVGAPALCLVGPPGVGRSVIARAVAEGLGRPFARIDVNTLRTAGDLLGERHTLVGATPGRMVEALREAGSLAPVLLLDGLDELGDEPDAGLVQALLALLDPARRERFMDRFLGVPLDLSGTLIVATAMTPYTIPEPFLDALEMIDVPGYIDAEKLEIARRRLIPKQLERHGLAGHTLALSDEALLTVIHRYTREPGVWQLSRALATLCRKLARETAFGRAWPDRLESMEVMRHLGRPPVQSMSAEPKDEVGVAMGLAWTSEGGDILPIEAVRLPGAGDVQLTGQLGDVLRESAAAALSFVRSRAEALEVPPTAFAEASMHIHLPEGAIPKDGPSAGLALAVVIASLMTNRPVRHDVAMTGEITLRGRILPVGGIREKVLGAHRAGIRTVILPATNADELEDVPPAIREAMSFISVSTADEALAAVLGQRVAPALVLVTEPPREKSARAARPARARRKASGGKEKSRAKAK